jgi:hypothetical protein
MSLVKVYGPEAMMCLGGGGGGTVGGSSHYGALRRPIAPLLVGVSAMVDTDGGSDNLTPTIASPSTNSIILAVATRVGGSANIIAPGSQGWTEFANEGISTLEDAELSIFWKRWGSGATDDTTPTFTDDTGGGSDWPWSMVCTTWDNCITTGDPYESAHGGANGTGTVLTAPSVANNGIARTAFWVFIAEGSSSLTTFSSSSNAYSGASYGASTGGNLRATAGRYFRDFDGVLSGTCTAETGANNWAAYSVVLKPQPV